MGRAWPERRDPALSRRGYLELLRAVLADPGRQAGGGDRRVLDPGGLAEHHRVEVVQALPQFPQPVRLRQSRGAPYGVGERSLVRCRGARGRAPAQPRRGCRGGHRASAGALHRRAGHRRRRLRAAAPELLRCDAGRIVEEQLYSHLLKSNCPVTGQPDWGTLVVDYRGPALDPASLLAYLVSFRQHQDFHEQCVERIFLDLQRLLQPQALSVYARYVRRGGLDINPYRSLAEVAPTTDAWCASNASQHADTKSPGHAGAFHFGKSFRYPCWPGSARWSGACRRGSGG